MKKATINKLRRIATIVLVICMVFTSSVFAGKKDEDTYTEPKQAATNRYVEKISENENMILVLGKYPSCNSCKLDFGKTNCFVIKAECSGMGQDVGGVIWIGADKTFSATEEAAIIAAVQKGINCKPSEEGPPALGPFFICNVCFAVVTKEKT